MPYGLDAKPSGAKQQLSSEGRARAREAARMIPGFAPFDDARRAAERARQEAARNTPQARAVEAQRAAATRIARLQTMHARLMQQGNVADAEEVMAIIESLRPQAERRAMSPQAAQQRNAFAGMGRQ